MNNMESDTEDSAVQGSKDKEIVLISKVSRKKKVFKRRNWGMHNVKVISIRLLRNLPHPNIYLQNLT